MREKESKHKAPQGLTFKTLIFVPFCIVLMVQVAVCVGVLLRSGTIENMEADAYNLLSEQVSRRANYLENDMIFRWSAFDEAVEGMGHHVDTILARTGSDASRIASGSDEAVAIVDEASQDVVSFLRYSGVDGIYFVLGGNDGAESAARTALYVRDSNPKVDLVNKSDLLLAVCPISVSRNLNIALDSQWTPAFEVAPEGDPRSAFYYEPLRAAQQHPHASVNDLGYWGKPVDFGWGGVPTITFSKPVKSASGDVVGVLGVEIRLDSLSGLLPHEDFGLEGEGSYALAVTREDNVHTREDGVAPVESQSREYEIMVATGASQSLYVTDDALVASRDNKGRIEVQSSLEGVVSDRALASVREIKLYDSTSPFSSERWALIGLEQESTLFSSAQRLTNDLIKVFGISIFFGLIIAALTAWVSSSRLRHLMKEVRAAQPEQPIAFTSTGIVEVDELSEAIEILGTEVAASASRLSQTLKLSDRSIAAFECNPETQIAAFTEGFFSTVGLAVSQDSYGDKGIQSGGRMSLQEFKKILKNASRTVEKEADNRWIISDMHTGRWLRITTVNSATSDRIFGLVEDVTDEISTLRRIEHERDHDVLTGLLNRRAFEHNVKKRLFENPPSFGAMIMLDLDNLKYINDTYGHDWGDHYIKAAARVLDVVFRGKGFYARVSGDEFLVFIDQCPNDNQVQKLSDSFMHALDTSVLEAPDGVALKVRASAGAAFYPEDANDFERLREYADFAMYEAKNSRKGMLLRFDKKVYDQSSFILSYKEDLNRLIEENLVDFHFQPIVDARLGEVAGYEALMRPRLESISTPDRVLLLARAQSKLYRVEKMTFFGALKAFSCFDYTRNSLLFINSIATQRMSSSDEEILHEKYPELLKRAVIEITESDYSRETSLYKEKVARHWGSRLAIDDFGSGYSGETALLDYRVDFVKLDMGVVRNIDTIKDHQDIARNLITYAHDRDICVVAEGVETEAELKAVIELEVDYIQGYFTGKPAAEPPRISEETSALIRRFSKTF